MIEGAASPTIGNLRLDQFLKLNAVSGTGGQAKLMIQSGKVKVNGQIETRRSRKLSVGDVVEVGRKRFVVNELYAAA
jgi:ribosome-associated protein